MNKINLIIQREYLTRVKKKSFIIMTILGPILMAALFIVPVYIARLEGESKMIGIIDETNIFSDKFINTENINFVGIHHEITNFRQHLEDNDLYAILHIPKTELSVPTNARLYSIHQPNIVIQGYIRETIRKEVEALKLEASGIDQEVLRSIKTSVNLMTILIKEDGEEKAGSTELSMVVGFVGALLIYIFIFMYGALVMRGVIEEKTSRIVEVIISSVKPFQLMMGKVIGVVMVGLTQFMLWIVLTLIIISVFFAAFSGEISAYESAQLRLQTDTRIIDHQILQGEESAPETSASPDVNEMVISIFNSIQSINWGVIIIMFLFYFIGGYLLYGALFAAIGAAADSETDTQQFMMPLTIPLILSIIIAQFIMYNPDGPAAFWLSVFPFTSPVIMMIRIPFGVPYTDLAISVLLMILGFLGTIWLAARIYRTGILMYGKKINYRELWKWIRY
jgi:ABC-2 type transport system permease protein